MIIYYILEKGKNWFISKLSHYFIPILVLFVSVAIYTTYKLILYEHQKIPISIDTSRVAEYAAAIQPLAVEKKEELNQNSQVSQNAIQLKKYVASHGGKNYYDIRCPQAKRISEKNKVYFPSKEIAEMAGYKAANCQTKKTSKKK